MKPLNEKILIKEVGINKFQYDRVWYFHLEDMTFYLKENLSDVEFIHLPMIIDGEQEFVKCASFDDIVRGRKEVS
jgi:hypothetical protein